MTEVEYKALVDKVGEAVAAQIKAATGPLQIRLDEFEAKLKGANTEAEKADIAKQITDAVKASDEALRDILTKQGESIKDLQSKMEDEEDEDEEEDIIKALAKKADQMKAVKKAGAGIVEFQLGYKMGRKGQMRLVAKAADVQNTTTVGANASITTSLSNAAILRAGADQDEINTINRPTPWILDFVSVGNTTSNVITWFDEVPKQGDFAVTAEGAIKPLVMYTFNRTSASSKKAAGKAIITEEFEMDFPRLLSTIKDLMNTDCRNEMNDILLTDMIASASAYSNPVMVGQIDNADNYSAIAAAAGQIGNAYHTANVLVMNNNQGIVSASKKGDDGQYINPENILKEINANGMQMLKHPEVAFGNFFIGDGSVYKVLLRGDLVVRIGFSGDDFDRNQYRMVVEQHFYSYISQAKRRGLVYASFNAVKASIETP